MQLNTPKYLNDTTQTIQGDLCSEYVERPFWHAVESKRGANGEPKASPQSIG
jgi:hypothetical protein